MRISVLIPTYHRNDLLAKCLEQLAPGKQTLAPDQYEVIVSDDGRSTTAEAMIREKYPWARWVAGPKQGPAANRNHAVQQVQSEWLAFTDDDCIPSAGWLQAYVDAIQPNVFVYEGCTTCEMPYCALIEETPKNLVGGNLWSCNFLIHRSAFEKVAGFDETFPYPFQEDTDFRVRLKAAGYSFPFVDKAIVDHPPRPRRFGARMGQVHESDVLLWYKGGQKTSVAVPLLRNIISAHFNLLKRDGPFSARATAIRSFWGEFFHVLLHVRAWEAKYKDVTPVYQYRQI